MPPKSLKNVAKRKQDAKAERLLKKQCWNNLLECRHNLDESSECPLCKLVQLETREYYKQERIKKLAKIAAGGLERALMRSELLEMWAQGQLSSYGFIKLGIPSAEISMCANTLTALSWYCEYKEEDDTASYVFRDVSKDLEVRKRVHEIGHYAALCIQRFIRSCLCRKRVKLFMMKRFEYTFPSRLRLGYYTDRTTKMVWPDAPVLFRHERPTSPRTLVRRINTKQKKMEEKEEKMKQLLADEISNPGKVWRDKAKRITHLRQLAILRDVICCAFKTLTKRQTRNSEYDLPLWLSLSQPAPAARQFGLNLVLENDEPLPEMTRQVVLSEKEVTSSDVPTDGEVINNTKATEPKLKSPQANELSINDRLQILEECAWRQLKCESPEDVIDKLTCEEVQPALSSGHQIAEDLHQMWIGNVNFDDISSLMPTKYTESTQHTEEQAPAEAAISAAPQDDALISADTELNEFDNYDEELFLSDEFNNDYNKANRSVGAEAASFPTGTAENRSLSSMNMSSMDSSASVISPLITPRAEEGIKKWNSSVFPSFVFVPPIPQHNKNLNSDTNEAVDPSIVTEQGDLESVDRDLIDDPNLEVKHASELSEMAHEKQLVVPVQVQLRPYLPNRHCSGIFRLFFYDGNLVAATQGSSWTFYSQICELKDSIAASILKYAESESCQQALNAVLKKNESYPGNISGNASLSSQKSAEPSASGGLLDLASLLGSVDISSGRNNLLPPISKDIASEVQSVTDSQSKEVGRSECLQLYVPSADNLFGNMDLTMAPENAEVVLTADECREQQNQNKFLRHLSSWKVAMKAAIKRGGSKKKKSVAEGYERNVYTEEAHESQVGDQGVAMVDVATTADNSLLADIGRKFGISVPYASDLVSAEYFRLLNLDVPISQRPHMASRELFLKEYFSTNGYNNETRGDSGFVGDIVYQNEKFPLLKYEPRSTDLRTLISPILLKSNIKQLHAPKFRRDPNASWYLSEMLRIACSVNLNMNQRLRSMRPHDASDDPEIPEHEEGIVYKRAVQGAVSDLGVEPLASTAPPMDTVVIDVFVDIPRANLKDNSRFA